MFHNNVYYIINVFPLDLRNEIIDLRGLVYRMQKVVSVNVCSFKRISASNQMNFNSSSIELKMANGKAAFYMNWFDAVIYEIYRLLL